MTLEDASFHLFKRAQKQELFIQLRGLHCCKSGTEAGFRTISIFFYDNGAGNSEVLSTDLKKPCMECLLHFIKRGFSQALPSSVGSIPALLTDGSLVLEYGTQHTSEMLYTAATTDFFLSFSL